MPNWLDRFRSTKRTNNARAKLQNEFAGWYSSLSFNDDANYIAKRWASVEKLIGESDGSDLELLIQIAFRIKVQTGSAEVAALRSKLSGDLGSPGDEEFALLAAAALAYEMNADSDEAALAATAVSTASCAGLRPVKQPMDLLGISENVLRRMAETSRRRPALEAQKPPKSTLDPNEVTAFVSKANGGEHGEAAQAIATSTNKILSGLAKRQASFEAAVQRYVLVQDEELDILWWLLGNHCNDLGLSFSEIPPEQRPLAIARELARLTTVLPGPSAVTSLLTRAGVSAAPRLSIAAAVQGMPAKWLAEALGQFSIGQSDRYTKPILFAFVRHQELEGNDGWIQGWSKLTGLDQATELGPLQLAETAYREFVLAKLG
ncbi:GTPase-associated system all-helical protein GASH [Massilia sp. LXY-6]|uniref:GTPase-associated system all-helical protein GASH n=1 Tax=Massilia sp. LXY-6 TaxID=3379823 RepID=UPI003EE24E27